jgi:hypothetical protein
MKEEIKSTRSAFIICHCTTDVRALEFAEQTLA